MLFRINLVNQWEIGFGRVKVLRAFAWRRFPRDKAAANVPIPVVKIRLENVGLKYNLRGVVVYVID